MAENNREPKCIIISAGDLSDIEIDIADGDLCIACDAGFLHAERRGILPDLIVGDFDSLREHGEGAVRALQEINESDPGRVVQLEVKKDDTDTLKAVRIGLSKGYRKFYFYGALGGKRIEHSFANIQTLLFLKHHGAKGYIFDRDKMLMVIENESVKFNRGNTGMISVFALSEKAEGVTLKGLMYNMESGALTNDLPLGVSNEFIIDEEAEIAVLDGSLLITVFWGQ